MRKTKRTPRLLYLLILSVLFAAGEEIWTRSGGEPRGEKVLVSYAADGDTIRVGRGRRCTTVSLIGVDTPETVYPEKSVEFFGPPGLRVHREVPGGKMGTPGI